MKTTTKIFAIVLAFTMLLTTVAFAAWPSYQGNDRNNGVILTDEDMPIDEDMAVKYIQLPAGGTAGSNYWSGIDTKAVIDDGRAYVLYNGGTDGGARLACVNLSTATGTAAAPGAPNWDIQIDGKALNVAQLSTPYLDTESGALYAAVTYYNNELVGTGVTGWHNTANQQISSFSFPVGETVIHYDGLNIPADYWQPQVATNISTTLVGNETLTGSVVLTNTRTGETYDFGTSYFWSGDFTLYYNNGNDMIPAGNYTLTVTIDNGTGAALSATSFQFLTTRWELYKITNIGIDEITPANKPAKAYLTGGYGQADTPIASADSKLFFGIYEGDRCYYQYDTEAETTTAFKPEGGDDFYSAGSAVKGSNVVFGSDSGKLYTRPIGVDFGSAAGSAIDLTSIQPAAGKIRSSICVAGDDLYLTSNGEMDSGYIWKIPGTGAVTAIPLPQKSTSTPVVSENGFVYVGYSNGFSAGGIAAVKADAFSTLYDVCSIAPVQASPIVYSDDTTDYIYFTTNTYGGKGYCYKYDTDQPAVPATQGWGEGGTGLNNYAMQGFSSDDGFLVYGDDGNMMYIMSYAESED